MTHPVAVHRDVAWLPDGSLLEVRITDEPVREDLCSSAFALVPSSDGHHILMSNVLKRGFDLPGGHVEAGESPVDCAIRETREETGHRIEILGKIGHFRILVPNPPQGYRYPTPETFQVFYLGRSLSVGPVEMFEECGKPEFLDLYAVKALPRARIHGPLLDFLIGHKR